MTFKRAAAKRNERSAARTVVGACAACGPLFTHDMELAMGRRRTACASGLLLAATLLFALGCGDTARSKKDGEKVYDIKGKVTKVSADKNTVKIHHEDIPGLMKGMEMTFNVEDAKVL